MEHIQVPARDWLPDMPDLNNPGIKFVRNVFPTSGGWGPVNDIEFPTDSSDFTADTTIDSSSIVAIAHANKSGDIFVGEASGDIVHIEKSTGVATSVKGAGHNLPSGDVNVAEYEDIVYFAHSSGVYRYQGAAVGTKITGSPACFAIGRVGSFLMAGNGTTLTWSAFNDPDTWTITPGNQAGFSEVNNPEYGRVTAIVGGHTPLVFQTHAISRLNYVGGALVWNTVPISTDFGGRNGGATVIADDLVYFLDTGGPCVTDGASVRRLGDNAVNRWVAENFSTRPLRTIHWRGGRKIIWVSFSFASTNPSIFLVYDYSLNRFSNFIRNDLVLLNEEFASVAGGEPRLFGVAPNGGTHHVGPLTGAALEAEITTGHLATKPGFRTAVNSLEPQYEGTGATCAVSTKETASGAPSVSAYAGQNGIGLCEHSENGRYVALSTKFPAGSDWADFSGWIAKADVAGEN